MGLLLAYCCFRACVRSSSRDWDVAINTRWLGMRASQVLASIPDHQRRLLIGVIYQYSPVPTIFACRGRLS